MPTPLYADVHVPGPVILQLRLRGVDIAAATEEGHERKTDEELLIVSTSLGRVMVTQDIRFRVLAEDWQRQGRLFAGLIFAHQRRVSFGDMVGDLELIARATDPAFWLNRIEQLPL
ncbi:MAG: DUF5615 family PIN-like protein [Methylacidiphilales bacterium]|nr:DUF5615 family PIN-like protein [Candidatus Methylacidiphilales bacterium]